MHHFLPSLTLLVATSCASAGPEERILGSTSREPAPVEVGLTEVIKRLLTEYGGKHPVLLLPSDDLTPHLQAAQYTVQISDTQSITQKVSRKGNLSLELLTSVALREYDHLGAVSAGSGVLFPGTEQSELFPIYLDILEESVLAMTFYAYTPVDRGDAWVFVLPANSPTGQHLIEWAEAF